MLQFVRFIKGYLVIRVTGSAPERFINLCSNHQILLWDITIQADGYRMKIGYRDFYRIKGFTRKTGTRVVVTERFGLPFLSGKIWKRRIFVAGVAGSLLFWLLMSTRIWTVDIRGNYYITDDVFMDFLAENEIRHGMRKEELAIEELEKAIRNRFDMVTWTSVKLSGSRLLVQIKENELYGRESGDGQEKTPIRTGQDLVADTDGVITSIVTRSGVPLVKAGSEVKKGDVLVEGAVPIMAEDGSVKRYDFCKADADIFIQCRKKAVEELPLFYNEKNYSGRSKTRKFIELSGHRFLMGFPIKGYEEYDILEDKRQLILFGSLALPVFYGTEEIREYSGMQQNYTEEQVKEIFAQKINKILQSLEEKGVQIIEKDVTIKKEQKKWKLEVTFSLVEKTGLLRDTVVSQIAEQTVLDLE